MGLAIEVGILADLALNDPEGAQYFREEFEKVNELLQEFGLPPHQEPETVERLENRCGLCSYPYSFIHYLRRTYAHRVNDPTWVATPLAEDVNPTEDPVLDEVTMRMESHLLCHSDAEGFYIPIDFKDVLFDDQNRVPGGMLGSSYRLLEELTFVAPALGIRLEEGRLSDTEADDINAALDAEEGLWLERIVWLSLFEAARLSIEHKSAISFC